MPNWILPRVNHWKSLFRLWWVAVYSFWGFLTVLDTLIPKYCSREHIAQWQKVWLLAAIDPKIGLIGFLFITLVLALEASYRKVEELNKLVPNRGKTKEVYEPKPNIVFSHCHRDAMSLGEEEEIQIFGAWIAEFFNDALNPQDRVTGVVAHLVYFIEPKPGRETSDPLWITRQGLWEPGHDGLCDFLMNERGKLVLALTFSEDRPKPARMYAVGYRPQDKLHPYGMETFEIENNLPVIVKVTLRGPKFQRVFRFKLAKKANEYICEHLPTAS